MSISHNNAGNSFTNFNLDVPSALGGSSCYQRLNRVWQVQVVGTPGTISMEAGKKDLFSFGSATYKAVLLVSSSENDFSNATIIQPNNVKNGKAYFSNLTFTHGQYFTFAFIVAGPGGVTNNMSVWFNASDNVYTNASGTTSASKEGDLIANWGNAALGATLKNVSNTDVNEMPSYKLATFNFNPSLYFNKDVLFSTSINTTDYRFPNSVTSILAGSDYGDVSLPDRDNVYWFHDDGAGSLKTAMERPQSFFGSATKLLRNPTLTSAELYTFTNTAATGYRLMSNHKTVGSGIANNTTSVAGPFRLGSNSYDPKTSGNPAIFDLGEFVIYKDDKSPTTSLPMRKIHTYFAIKYGYTLDAAEMGGAYYASDGSKIFTYTGFWNRITGIGRDDCSALEQRQSRSIHSEQLITLSLGDSLAVSNNTNAFKFGANNQWQIFGDNNKDLLWSGTDIPYNQPYMRLLRVWRMSEVGTVGKVYLEVPDFTSNASTKLPKATKGIYLIVANSATNGKFGSATGVKTFLMSFDAANKKWFTTYDFVDGDYFTFGTEKTCVAPAGISEGLTSWYKATDMALGDIPATTGTIKDEAFGNYTLTSSSAGTATVNAGTNTSFNYNRSISFSANREFAKGNLTVNDIFTPSTGSSMAVATNTSGGILGLNNLQNNITGLGTAARFNGVASTFPAIIAGKPNILGMIANNPTGITSFANGTASATTALTTNRPASGTYSATLNVVHWDGWLNNSFGEAFTYNRALTTVERHILESYLAIKYGQTLTHNYFTPAYDGINQDSTTAYDISTYPSRILGVAIDSTGCLFQKQSTSMLNGSLLKININNTFEAENTLNSKKFKQDRSYLMMGDNNGAIDSWTVGNGTNPTPAIYTGTCATVKRLVRQWKVTTIGQSPTLLVAIPDSISNEVTKLPSIPSGHSLYMVINDENNFGANTNQLELPMTLNTTTKHWEANYEFPSGTTKYICFTIKNTAGTLQPAVLASAKTVVSPSSCNAPNWVYYKGDAASNTANNAIVSIKPNGNIWSPDSVIVYRTSAKHTAKASNGVGSLMNYFLTIDAPGTFSVNGGISVRWYYPNAIYADVENDYATKKWFKLTGSKSDVLAAFAADPSLSAATTLTPTLGSENGINYVQFDNITAFSTFGFVSSCTIAGVGMTKSNDISCTNPSITLTAMPTTGVIYAWSGGGTAATKSITAAGTYTVTMTETTSGCTATATMAVISNTATPNASITKSDDISCINPNITLTAMPATGVTYAWSGSGTTATQSVTSAGAYTVTVTDETNGCTKSATSIVANNTTPPTANAGTDASLTCTNTTTTLGVSMVAGYTYSWSPSTGLSANNIPQPTTNTANTYTVIVTNTTNGCTATDAVVITNDKAVPMANIITTETSCIANDNKIATGQSATLTASGGTSYSWTPSTGLSSTTLPTAIASPPITTNYTVVVTGTNGCTATATALISVVGSCVDSDGDGIDDLLDPDDDNDNVLDVNDPAPLNPCVPNTAAGTCDFDKDGLKNEADPDDDNDNITDTNDPEPYNPCAPTNQASVSLTKNNDLTCSATQATLTATATLANATYAWSAGVSPVNGTNTGLVNAIGTYTVTVTANTCTATAAIAILQNNIAPTASIVKSNDLSCTTTTATLTALPATGVTYAWNGGGIAATKLETTAGTYTVTVKNTTNGCTNTASIVVMGNTTKPTAAISKSNDITCAKSSATLTAAPATNVNYEWNGGETTSTKSISAIGTYTVTITSTSNGCTDSATITIIEDKTAPTANAGNDVTITCSSATATLGSTTVSGNTYIWSPTAGLSASNISQPTTNVAGTYTVTVTGANGCTATDAVTVVSNTTAPSGMNISISESSCTANDGKIIKGQSATLTLSAVGGISYVWSPATGLSSTTLPTVNANPTNTTTYTVVATSNAGCTASATILVSIIGSCTDTDGDGIDDSLDDDDDNDGILDISDPAPLNPCVPNVFSPSCDFDNDDIININDPDDDNDTILDATDSQPYNPCVPNNPANVTLIKSNDLSCTISLASLTATAVTTGATYSWSAGITTVNGLNIGGVSAAGTYTVTATLGTCTNSATIIVNGNTTPPVALVSKLSDLSCKTTSTTLTATPATGVTYTWSGGGTTATKTVTTADTYTVTVTSTANGCSATASVTVVGNTTPPAATINKSNDLSCTTTTVTLTAMPSTGVSYNWDNAATTATRTITTAGTYTVTITNMANECTATANMTVNGDTVVPTNINIVVSEISCTPNDAKVAIGQNATLTASATGANTFAWSPSTGLSSTTLATIIATPTATTTYTVVASSSNGCTTSATTVITIVGSCVDTDGDGLDDTSDPDDDNDNVLDGNDPAPLDACIPNVSAGACDFDNDGTRNSSDTDDDNDGVADANDPAPYNACLPSNPASASLSKNSDLSCGTNSIIATVIPNNAIYTWSSGMTPINGTNTANITAVGTYTVTVTVGSAALACTGTATLSVAINTTPPTPTIAVAETDCTANDGKILATKSATISATGGVSYAWSPDNGLSTTTSATVTASPAASTTYIVTVTGSNGCTATASQAITIVGSCTDTDGDGIDDSIDTDDDNDGILDGSDTAPLDACIPNNAASACDFDKDGTINTNDPDDDNDGTPDSGDPAPYNPCIPNISSPVCDADNDGLANNIDNDDDGDGLSDTVEGVVDTDNDGVPNYLDTDSDGDGAPDNSGTGVTKEDLTADLDADGISNYLDGDSDNDGLTDNFDPDDDNDGVPDTTEGNGDADNDGIPNRLDKDSDNDGINDGFGAGATKEDEFSDLDNDGTPNYLDNDSDNDGTPDQTDTDDDADGISDSIEGNTDTDGDGIPNRLDKDSDGDGINDGAGIASVKEDHIADLDADGIPNYLDNDSDNDGLPDQTDPDDDNDGIPDTIEGTNDTDNDGIPNRLDKDSDGDGILDAIESIADTDGDGIPNFMDTDSDGDGSPDSVEGAGDRNGDGIPNYADKNDIITGGGSSSGIKLTSKIFLQGAFNITTGLMKDDLRNENKIPTAQPYAGTPYSDFAYTGTETVSSTVLSVTGNNAIVDWILVELRDPTTSTTVVARRAALVQRDGDIVDTDGTSPLTFANVANGSYYVVVRHRNHLGAMIASPVALNSTTPVVVDFTSPTLDLYKRADALKSDYPMRTITSGASSVRMLWQGNASKDKRILVQGSGSDVAIIQFAILGAPNNPNAASNYVLSGYYREDINMSGEVVFQGSGSDTDFITFTVFNFPVNTNKVANFIINQQLP